MPFDMGLAPPTDGTWSVPFFRFNSAPELGGIIGWTIVVGGTPGTWAPVGFVSANDSSDADLVVKNLIVKEGPFVDPMAYGVKGDGVTDDLSAFQAAAAAAAGKTLRVPAPSVSYKVSGSITIASNTEVVGKGRPLIITTSKVLPIFTAGAVDNVTIRGFRLQGAGSDGAAADEGLISINPTFAAAASNIRIFDNEVSGFKNGITAIRVNNLWVERNVVHNFLRYGILGSLSSGFNLDRNVVHTCDQSGADNAYGIMVTGDDAAGIISGKGSISHNTIYGVRSWDGIMTHDVTGLRIIGNEIRDCRTGIDVGHFAATNVVKDIVIANNFIESTTVNTYGAGGAIHGGILVIGANAANRIEGVTVANNTIKNFFNVAGLVLSGDCANITIESTRHATVTGNVIINAGSQQSNPGIYIVGSNDGLTVSGNTMEGAMVSGGIRLATVSGDAISIVGNAIQQATGTDAGVMITGSTLTGLGVGENVTNCDAGYQFAISTSTITHAGTFKTGSLVYDPASLADGTGVSVDVLCTGAELGDFVLASFSLNLQGITMTAYVKTDNYVTVRFQNETGAAIDLASGTIRVRVFPA